MASPPVPFCQTASPLQLPNVPEMLRGVDGKWTQQPYLLNNSYLKNHLIVPQLRPSGAGEVGFHPVHSTCPGSSVFLGLTATSGWGSTL